MTRPRNPGMMPGTWLILALAAPLWLIGGRWIPFAIWEAVAATGLGVAWRSASPEAGEWLCWCAHAWRYHQYRGTACSAGNCRCMSWWPRSGYLRWRVHRIAERMRRAT